MTSPRNPNLDPVPLLDETGVSSAEATTDTNAHKKSSVVSTALMVLCQMAGVGILQVPYMLKQGGWVMLGFIFVCGCLSNYTGKLLIAALYSDGDSEAGTGRVRVGKSYSDVAARAFGKTGRLALMMFERATLLGVSCLFLVLAGKFVFELVSEIPFFAGVSSRAWSSILGLVLAIPLLVCETIGELKLVPLLGVAATCSVVIAVIVTALVVGVGSEGAVEHSLVESAGIAPAFSALSLSLACHAGLPAVEEQMRRPEDFPKAFNLAYAVLLLGLYIPLAIVGYGVYGNGVYSPILCSLPRTGAVQISAKVLVTAHTMLTYPVLMSLFFADLECKWDPKSYTKTKRALLRGAAVGFTVLVAVFVPYFDSLMSFVGALCVVATVFVFPPACHVKIAWTEGRREGQSKFFDFALPLLVAVLGSCGGMFGVLQSLMDLVQKVSDGTDPNSR
jgi:amino acid permease